MNAEMIPIFPQQKTSQDPALNAAGEQKPAPGLAFLSDSQMDEENPQTNRSWVLWTVCGFVAVIFVVTVLVLFILYKYSQFGGTTTGDPATSSTVHPSRNRRKIGTTPASRARRNIEDSLPKTFQNLNDSEWSSTSSSETIDDASVGLSFVAATPDVDTGMEDDESVD